MTRVWSFLGMAGSFCFAGCASSADGASANDAPVTIGASSETAEPDQSAGDETGDGVAVMQVEGVWIATHDPPPDAEISDAEHGGPVTLQGGCLVIEGALIVWHVDLLDDARALARAAHEGATPDWSGGGRGSSDVPPQVLEHCAGVEELFYAWPQ